MIRKFQLTQLPFEGLWGGVTLLYFDIKQIHVVVSKGNITSLQEAAKIPWRDEFTERYTKKISTSET